MIHVFIGTKAQLIKMAPVMRTLQDRGIDYNFVFSGQHQETITDLRANFGLKAPNITLYTGEDITSITKMLKWSIRLIFYTMKNRARVWQGDKTGVVLNHGDTFSTLIGSLLAKLSGLKNAHIESGLRSFKLFHPFPEELTRLCVFRLTDYFFCPTKWAESNLNGYKGVKINTEANTLYDSLRMIKQMSVSPELKIPKKRYAVASLHRFENLYSKSSILRIVELIERIADSTFLLFILHKPTRIRLEQAGLLGRLEVNPNIEMRPRYDYLSFIALVREAAFVVTDGGSNQEECFYMGKPCLLFRNATERQEGIDNNVVLSQFREETIIHFLNNIEKYRKPEVMLSYTPSQIIVDYVKNM